MPTWSLDLITLSDDRLHLGGHVKGKCRCRGCREGVSELTTAIHSSLCNAIVLPWYYKHLYFC